jgi:hypothetical protein
LEDPKVVLRRYWFEFELRIDDPHPLGVLSGCGVTAFDFEDALSLLRDRVFHESVPHIVNVIEDVDVSTLDPGHVLPNMGVPSLRGVWYPLGYN